MVATNQRPKISLRQAFGEMSSTHLQVNGCFSKPLVKHQQRSVVIHMGVLQALVMFALWGLAECVRVSSALTLPI